VVIGKQDGAQNFSMRVFEIAPGGHTPKHAHPWEHEMFIMRGKPRSTPRASGAGGHPATWSSSRARRNIKSATPVRSW
jgi:quercetin dioxygenase-like cupin family protein